MKTKIMSGNFNWDVDVNKIIIPEKDIRMLIVNMLANVEISKNDYPSSIKELNTVQRELFLGMLQHGLEFLSKETTGVSKKETFVQEIMKTQKELHNNDILNIMLRLWKNYENTIVTIFNSLKGPK